MSSRYVPEILMASHTRVRVPSVLVVDDSRPLRLVIKRMLERQGMVVTTAGSRAAGLAQTGHFVVGVFDLDLGDGTGVEVAAHLLGTGQVLHCVFFSGGASEPVMERARELGSLLSKGDGVSPLVTQVLRLACSPGTPDRRLA